MIRFINIGDQVQEGNKDFAFYDTISDSFVSFDGEQLFESVEDFKAHYKDDSENDIKQGSRNDISRYFALMPVGMQQLDKYHLVQYSQWELYPEHYTYYKKSVCNKHTFTYRVYDFLSKGFLLKSEVPSDIESIAKKLRT